MKFSDNTNDLIKQLLVGAEGEYLGARDAVREANRDLINHQNAFLEAMNSAFIEFADRFDPDELQAGFERTMKTRLFAFMNKGKYWDLYRELYPIMTEKGGGKFPQMFGEEFVKAYERQIAEYQRFGRDGTTDKSANDPNDLAMDPGLAETQKLEPSQLPVESAFEKDDVIDALENSTTEDISQAQLKA